MFRLNYLDTLFPNICCVSKFAKKKLSSNVSFPRVGVPKVVDGIIQGVDKHPGSKRGRPGVYSKGGRDTEQQFHRAWYAVSLTNVYGNGLSI